MRYRVGSPLPQANIRSHQDLTNRSIIAVHGLDGDSIDSWTAGSCCWIRDLLPRSCSTARIMTYGYNANLFSDLASGRIADYADDLLAEIHSHRDHDQVAISISADMEHCQPLIFFFIGSGTSTCIYLP